MSSAMTIEMFNELTSDEKIGVIIKMKSLIDINNEVLEIIDSQLDANELRVYLLNQRKMELEKKYNDMKSV